MISQMDIKGFFLITKKLYSAFNKQNQILEDGLGSYKNILIWYLPICCTITFFLAVLLLNTHLSKLLNSLISILPSLIGFLIASATIIVSINSKKISKKPDNCNHSYSQIGGSIFFRAIKISIVLLIIAFLSPDHLPSTFSHVRPITIYLAEALVLFLFSKLIILTLYGLLFLSTAIESNTD